MRPQAGRDDHRDRHHPIDGHRYDCYRNRYGRTRDEYRRNIDDCNVHHINNRNDFDLGDNKLDRHVLTFRCEF